MPTRHSHTKSTDAARQRHKRHRKDIKIQTPTKIMSKKFGTLILMPYLCSRKSGDERFSALKYRWEELESDLRLVPWMSGLVSGLQNRPQQFESARHLGVVEGSTPAKAVRSPLFFPPPECHPAPHTVATRPTRHVESPHTACLIRQPATACQSTRCIPLPSPFGRGRAAAVPPPL